MDRRASRTNGSSAAATAAIQKLIRISQMLMDISERETQALLQRDMLTFSILQDEKESVADQYTNASEDFRNRLSDFRTVEKSLLDRLESVQKNLAAKSRDNNEMVSKLRQQAETSTQKTLLMAQEYGQQRRVRYSTQKSAGESK